MNDKKYKREKSYRSRGFTLLEVITALAILAFITTTVLITIENCMTSTAESALRIQAFEIARENMEKLLSSGSVKETTDFGFSDRYPEIKWQTVVETFYEPITTRMWIQAVCSAEYTDTDGEAQTIELTHWITNVSKQQLLQIMKEQEKEQQRLQGRLITTAEEAAEYAGVDVETVEKWIDNGMLQTDDGSFVKSNLDLYKDSGGTPTTQQKAQQTTKPETTTKPAGSDNVTGDDEERTMYGYTMEELEQMDFSQVWQIALDYLKKNKQ